MRIERVDIDASPGIDRPFSVEGLSPALTVVLGRNGAGKSTLARAIRLLMWPERHAAVAARLVLAQDDTTFTSSISPVAAGWRPATPRMPRANVGRSIAIGIDALWTDGDTDASIRAAMARELRGGYDLAPLRNAAAERPKIGRAEIAGHRRAAQHLRDAQREARELMHQQDQLATLRRDANAARSKADRRSAIEQAQQRLGLQRRLEAVEAQLAALPAGALRVRGDEVRRLDERRQRIDANRRAAADADGRATAARERLESLGVPEGGVPDGPIALLGEHHKDAVALEQQIAETRRRIAEREPNAAAHASPMSSERLDQIDDALVRVDHARHRVAAIAGAESPRTQRVRPGAWPAASAACLALATLLVLAVLAGNAIAMAAAIAGLAAMAWLAANLRPRTEPETGASLEQARGELADAEAELRGLAGDDRELASTLALVVAARRAAEADRAHQELLAARAADEYQSEQLGGLLQRATAALASTLDAAPNSAADIAASVAQLRERQRRWTRETEIIAEAEHAAEAARDAAARDEEALAAELDELGLTPDTLPQLHEWLRERDRARTLDGERTELATRIDAADRALREYPALLEADDAALAAELRAAEGAAGEADELRGRIGGIEERIRLAGSSERLRDAHLAVDHADTALERLLEEESGRAARRLLLDAALSALGRDDLPPIVEHADGLLRRCTRGAYGLRAGGDGEPAVVDVRTGHAVADTALSSGTRAQVLLALRVAHAINAERDAGCRPLPLVLDEPLATTDDERFHAVAALLADLAGAGRQILYLTCEPAHARRLLAVAAERELDAAQLDLDAVRTDEAARALQPAMLAEPKAAPSPADLPAEEYARLAGVAPLDPWAPDAAIDLFYVLRDDLHAYAELARRGIRTAGALADAAVRGEAGGHAGAAIAARTARRAMCAWRRGRARPLTVADIAAAPAISETYAQDLADLAAELGGSADALLTELRSKRDERTKGFRKAKIADLEAYFRAEGLLPLGEPLDRDAVLREALPPEHADNARLAARIGHLIDVLFSFGHAKPEALRPQPA
ncbi:MAG: hypothetical protein AAFX79_05610 [Planctomycetota bacterium]